MPVDVSNYLQQERVECSIQAANHYHIPPLVLLAVAEQEGGKPGQKVLNRNGTLDYGAMQINTVSLAELRRFGIQEKHVLAKGCYPYFLAAWRIADHLHYDTGDLWQRAANYHSKTPYFNRIYRAKLLKQGAKLTHRLNNKGEISTISFKPIPNMDQHVIYPKKVITEPGSNTFSVYSAPIRVKSFDSLQAYSMQLMNFSITSVNPIAGSVGQSNADNGW